jgi:DNA topoisomerase-3
MGHLTNPAFDSAYKDWHYPPPERLFDAPVRVVVGEVGDYPIARAISLTNEFQDQKTVSENIETQARGAKALFIWTDCDREGEHIGSEVRVEALKGNPRLEIKRAKFSNIERA